MGRFITQDPIGPASGDTNLYRYVHNNPLTCTDPTGLLGRKNTPVIQTIGPAPASFSSSGMDFSPTPRITYPSPVNTSISSGLHSNSTASSSPAPATTASSLHKNPGPPITASTTWRDWLSAPALWWGEMTTHYSDNVRDGASMAGTAAKTAATYADQKAGQVTASILTASHVDSRDASLIKLAQGFGHGAQGGTSIYVNTLTYGATDYFNLTNSDQYQGIEYDISRTAAVISREALFAAGSSAIQTTKYGAKAYQVYDKLQSVYDVGQGVRDIADGHYAQGAWNIVTGAKDLGLYPKQFKTTTSISNNAIDAEQRIVTAERQGIQAYEVGTAGALKARSIPGDALDIHHVGQARPMEQLIPGYNRASGPAIAIPEELHRTIPKIRGATDFMPRQVLANDIRNLRTYTNAPNSSLQELIEMNKQMYPGAFRK